MNSISYAPGNWYCLARTQTVVFLPQDTERALIERVWDVLATGSGVERVFNALSGNLANGLAGVPPFAVVCFAEGLHVLLRGELQLTASDGRTESHVSGQGVTTWSERILDSQESWTLSTAAPASSAVGQNMLPLEAGIVMASAAVTGASTGASASSDEGVDSTAATLTEAATDIDAGEETIHPGLFAPTPEESDEEPAREEPAEEAAPEEPAVEPVPEEVAEQSVTESTSGYDHLWDQTVMRRVEDAAVRVDEDEDADESGAEASDDGQGAEDEGTIAPTWEPESAAEPDDAGPPAASAAPGAAAPVAALSTGLIDSVPWARSPDAAPPEDAPSPQPKNEPAVPASDLLGDHDGETVMRSDLPTAQDKSASLQSADRAESRATAGPTVLARLCPQGHANAPTVSLCSVCELPVSGDTQQVRRPSLGRMRLSTGDVYELETSLIVGRQPSVSRVQGSVMPRLVQVNSESGDISRCHVEVRLEGWHVMLCDLRATNGTVLIRVGQPPRRLGEGEMAILLDGDIAQLGQDVSLRFEDLR